MADFETIPPQTAAQMIAAGQCYVVDVRSPAEFQAHRIAGAHLLPMQELQQRHAEIPREADKKTLIVCEHGVRSVKTCAALAEQGWTNLMNVQGGMAHWIECGLPVASGTQADAETLRPRERE
jgi:rhodanese-related sulfurtransferase